MTSYSKRLSILAAPEIQDLYSIPKLSAQEQEYFFSLTDRARDRKSAEHNQEPYPSHFDAGLLQDKARLRGLSMARNSR